MKRIKENLPEKSKKKRKHSVMQKLSAVLLSLCLLMVSLPLDFCGAKVQAEGEKKEIVSFDFLQEENEMSRDVLKEENEMSRDVLEEENEMSRDVLEEKDEMSRDVLEEEDEMSRDVLEEEDELSQNVLEEEARKEIEKKFVEDITDIEKKSIKTEENDNLKYPSLGVIEEDTIWNSGNVGEIGEGGVIHVNEGVTLTICGRVHLIGNITIEGGGTIRGKSKPGVGDDMGFVVWRNSTAEMKDILFDGANSPTGPAISVFDEGTLILGEGFVFDSVKPIDDSKIFGNAGINIRNGGKGIFYNPVIQNYNNEENSAICIDGGTLKIYGGTYKNNTSTKGGCINLNKGGLEIYGGDFIGNTSKGQGGCISSKYGVIQMSGGNFEGNISGTNSTDKKEKMSGAVYVSPDSQACLYNELKFDENESSEDKFFLGYDADSGKYAKLAFSNIENNLTKNVKVHLEAFEGRVIAKGYLNYHLQSKRDMEKLDVVDINGGTWYKILNKEKNEIYLSSTRPVYHLHYEKNGGEGTVPDDREYDAEEEVETASGDTLRKEGSRFVGWNTDPNGNGQSYGKKEKFKIAEDLTLYAIFKEDTSELCASFYSGEAGQKEDKKVALHGTEKSGMVNTPKLKELSGWNSLGWNRSKNKYSDEIKENTDVTLTEDTSFYGIYQKDVTLSYDLNGAEGEVPEAETKQGYANVHEEISYQFPEFQIADIPSREGYRFQGWSSLPDGENSTLIQPKNKKTFENDTVLYAIWEKEDTSELCASFYSGEAGQKEDKKVALHGTEKSGMVNTPELKELSDWNPLGWSRSKNEYTDEIKENTDVTLTEDTSFYGIYQKDVTLSYDLNGAEGEVPEAETKQGYANVHEEISYQFPEFQIADIPIREGYLFQGWSSSSDGGDGTLIQQKEKKTFDSDTVLYAIWEKDERMGTYKVEHYLQDLEGDGYTKIEEDTQELFGEKNTVVAAELKTYQGFHENRNHAKRKAEGTVAEDGSLVLKLYYDRDIYEVNFDLNGGEGTTPEKQYIRY